MCGRFVLTAPLEAIERIFDVRVPATNLQPRYNIAPTQPVCVIRLADEDSGTSTPRGERELALMSWGLVPFWAKELPKGKPLINARSETVAEKPAFRGAYRHRRCLIPADGWYEWQARKSRGPKQPYLIRPKQTDMRPFAFAGIWERWHGPGGDQWYESFAVLTKAADAGLAKIHDRMPVVLDRASHDNWLHPGRTTGYGHEALAGLGMLSGSAFETVPVSTRVNRVSYDAPDLIEPVTITKSEQPRLL